MQRVELNYNPNDVYIDIESQEMIPLTLLHSEKSAPIESFVETFPDELLLAVIHSLPPADLLQLSKTCARLHRICKQELLTRAEPPFRHWRISLFSRQQESLNDDIEEAQGKQSKLGNIAAFLTLGALLTGIASHVTYKEVTSNRYISRDEKILVGAFLAVSLLILLTGIAKCIRNCLLDRNIHHANEQISRLHDKKSNESMHLRAERLLASRR